MRILFRLTLLLGLLATPLASQAAFHIMSIREVYAGSLANPQSQYVVLQMRANGQNQLSGHSIVVYNASGATLGTYTFSGSVANGANQSFVLIATAQAQAEFGVAPNLLMNADLLRAGGRVCFDNIDCFAWGSYSGSPTLPCSAGVAAQCQTGTPFRASEGLASGRAARRDISAGNASLLETADDTGSSTNDFDYASDPRPINNAGAAAPAPTVGAGFSLLDFSSTASLRLSAGALAQSGVLRLTPVEAAPSAVSVWRLQREEVATGFQTRFRFRITPNGGSGAEGFAFVLHNESNSSLGSGGGRLGYGGITNGLAVEFDTRFSAAGEIGTADPDPSVSPNRVSLHSLGQAANSASESATLASSGPLPQLDDGSVHTALVSYNGSVLSVFVDDMVTPVVQANVNLATLLDLTSSAAFVGFTSGSTPGLGDHDLLRWEFGDSLPPDCQEGRISLRLAAANVPEGINRRVFVDRLGGSCGAVSVNYLVGGGTAINGTDYMPLSGTLNWANGDAAEKSVVFRGLQDNIDELKETALFTLSNPTGGASLGDFAVLTLSIIDDDPTPVATISTLLTQVPENQLDVNFTVSLDRPSYRDVRLTLVTGGTATRNQDYVLAGAVFLIPAGTTSLTRPLDPTRRDIINDAVDEPNETLTLTLSAPAGAVIGTPSNISVLILDND